MQFRQEIEHRRDDDVDRYELDAHKRNWNVRPRRMPAHAETMRASVQPPPRLAARQYVSRTKFLPLSVERSSYLPLPDRFGSLTFVCGTFL